METIIGKLVTDEGFRRRFLADAAGVLGDRWELTPVEMRALLSLDPAAILAFADAIDCRLQKVDCEGE